MELPITFALASARHPAGVEAIMRKLRSGKSKHRGKGPEDLTWRYEWSVRIDGNPEEAMSPDDAVKDRVRRTHACLEGRIGHWRGYHVLESVPQEIADVHRRHIEEWRAERARVEALSPEERQREFNEALREASQYPGFMAVCIPVYDEADED